MFLSHSFAFKFCSCCFRQVFFICESKKWSLVSVDRWSSCTVTIGREFAWAGSALVVWTGLTVMLYVIWVHMFTCKIFHSSTKSLVLPLQKFTIPKLDLFFSLFGKLNLLNIAVYLLTYQYFEMEENLSHRNVGNKMTFFRKCDPQKSTHSRNILE